MTPELKTACEVIFQEHKLSTKPIKWDATVFRGRISIGLSEMAKETLVEKNILFMPKKSKTLIQLNPDVASADSYEEAERMIANKTSATVTIEKDDLDTYKAPRVVDVTARRTPVKIHIQLAPDNRTRINAASIKWYMKSTFLYVIWPVCGAAAGLLIAWLISLAI
jgi:hypothetical protein